MESTRLASPKLALFVALAPLTAAAGTATPLTVPLHFEPVPGSAASYVAHDGSSTFAFSADGTIVGNASGATRLALSGADPKARMAAEERLPGRSHYLRGTDPSRWRRDVPHYARLRYQDVYPGIDVVYYGQQQQVEHDFVVAPEADPSRIRIAVQGADRAELAGNGDLQLTAQGGVLTLHRPIAYQQIDGARRDVPAAFRLAQGDRGVTVVSFDLGSYDPRQTLVIDPVVTWSTLIGSSRDDEITAMAVDSAGNAYVTGNARWFDWPMLNALQPNYGDGTSLNGAGGYDAFVTKFAPDGTLVYSTYLGGNSTDLGWAIAVDSAGSAHVAGFTASTNFPTAGLPRAMNGVADAFVAKLTSDGSALVYATYLGGGTNYDNALAIAADGAGNTLVGGNTWSSDFPVLNALQPATAGGYYDAFLTKLAGTTGKILFSTYMGGAAEETINAITVGPGGGVFVAGSTTSDNFPTLNALQATRNGGSDGFVAKYAPNGKSLVFSTYLGGTRDEQFQAIALDSGNGIYVGGGTTSADFPVVNSLQPYLGAGSSGLPKRDAVIASLRYDGALLKFATFLGGTDEDYVRGIAVDADKNIYVGGTTYSADFPQANPFQAYGGLFDGFVAKIRPGQLLMASPLGGQGFDVVNAFGVDGSGNLYAAGRSSGGYPTVNAAVQATPKNKYFEGFVSKISQAGNAVPDTVELYRDTYGVRENKGVATIRLERTGTGYGAVSVRFATGTGTATVWEDYLPVDGFVQWNNGQLGPKYVQIVINGDDQTEPGETVPLSISTLHGFVVLGPRTAATLKIYDPLP